MFYKCHYRCRWLERAAPPSAFEYPAFNAGPRTCLGRGLAELEGVFVLASLLRRWRLRLAPGQRRPPAYGNSLTLPMRDGLRVTLEPRGWQ